MDQGAVSRTASRLIKQAEEGTLQGVNPRSILRALLLSEETFATVLFLLVLDRYGTVALTWRPDTIQASLEKEFGLHLPKITLDKIFAAFTVYTTNYFFKDVGRFIELCNIFAGDDFQPDEFDPADPGEILWGITEAMLIYPVNEDPNDTEFSAEIRGYIGEALHRDGLVKAPDVLRLGTRGNAEATMRSDFDDDPEMYGALWKVQQGRGDDLKTMVKTNLREMAMQLQLLPLENGELKQETLQQLQQVAGLLPAAQEQDTQGEML